LQHQFSLQEHPIVVAKAQDKHPNSAQAEKHVFQDFDMFSNNYLLQG
jgi:hypothetical protein